MYSINGISLDNPTLKWQLMAPTEPLSQLSYRTDGLVQPGVDGVAMGTVTRGSVSLKFVVKHPGASREAILALFTAGELRITQNGVSGREAIGRCVATRVAEHYPSADHYVDEFVVEIPSGSWRSTTNTTTPLQAAVAGGVEFTVFSGISAPIQDAVVRFQGGLTNPTLIDLTSGAYVRFSGAMAGGTFVRVDTLSGRAWLTTTDTWSGGSEVSGLVEMAGDRDTFELTPDTASPASRVARLHLNQTSYSGSGGVQIRARNAHLL